MTTSASRPRGLDWLRSSDLASLTIAETAEVMRTDRRTVSRAIADGQLPAVRLGRRVLVPRLRLLALLDGSRDVA